MLARQCDARCSCRILYNLVLENFAKMFVFKCSAINETEIKLAHVATHVKVCIGQKFHLNLIVSLRDTIMIIMLYNHVSFY